MRAELDRSAVSSCGGLRVIYPRKEVKLPVVHLHVRGSSDGDLLRFANTRHPCRALTPVDNFYRQNAARRVEPVGADIQLQHRLWQWFLVEGPLHSQYLGSGEK